MKGSIRNLAKAGIILSLLAFSNFLQANEDVSLIDNIPAIELKHSHHKHHRRAQHTNNVPIAVVISEELWRGSAIFLKDGLQLNAAGSTGNELQVVSQLIIDNATAINDFIYSQSNVPNNSDIQAALTQLSFLLYSYVTAFETAPDSLPGIISALQTTNDELYAAIVEALSVRACDRPALRNALDQRLFGLKQLAQAFVAAEIGEYDDVFDIFNENLQFGQRVGRIIGSEIIGNR